MSLHKHPSQSIPSLLLFINSKVYAYWRNGVVTVKCYGNVPFVNNILFHFHAYGTYWLRRPNVYQKVAIAIKKRFGLEMVV